MDLITTSRASADALAKRLADCQQKIVLAESCTAGMAAALLGGCPGISAWFCGSAVVYREATKTCWLGIGSEQIARFTAESMEVTLAMAEAALEETPEADLAAAITGHLGPQAPEAIDGKVFMAIAFRKSREVIPLEIQLVQIKRSERQLEAAAHLLSFAGQKLVRFE